MVVYWGCRISAAIAHDQVRAKKRGYAPMWQDIPHSDIRKMMDEPCVHCGEPLDWSQLGSGKTPHLDHDHETGEVNGFSHSSCNPHALKNMIEKLKADCAQAFGVDHKTDVIKNVCPVTNEYNEIELVRP